eukprot:377349_1
MFPEFARRLCYERAYLTNMSAEGALEFAKTAKSRIVRPVMIMSALPIAIPQKKSDRPKGRRVATLTANAARDSEGARYCKTRAIELSSGQPADTRVRDIEMVPEFIEYFVIFFGGRFARNRSAVPREARLRFSHRITARDKLSIIAQFD